MATFSTSGKYTTDRVRREFLEDQAKSQFIVKHESDIGGRYKTLEDYLAVPENRELYETETRAYISSMSKIFKFLDDSKTIISGLGTPTKQKRDKIPNDKKKVYQEFAPIARYILDIFSAKPANAIQTPGQLLNESVENDKKLNYAISYSKTRAYRVAQNMASAKRSFENILSKGEFIDYDLESMGEQITEHAFVHMGLDGKIVDTTNGVIGISDYNAKSIKEIINKYAEYGIGGSHGISENQLYIVQNAAKFANAKTKIEFENGNFVIKSFASNEDVAIPNSDEAFKGFDILRDIFKNNKKNIVDFKYGDTTYKIRKYEADILSNLLAAKDNGLTVATQNGMIFDNHQIERLFAIDSSDDARKLFYGQFDGDLNKSLINFDVVATLREADNPKWHRSDSGVAAAKANPTSLWNSSAVVTDRYAPGADKLTKELLGDYYVEHAAMPDAVKQALTVIGITNDSEFKPTETSEKGKQIPNNDYIFKKIESSNGIGKERPMHAGDIFFVDNSFVSSDGNGALSFVLDPLNGNIRFSGGAKVNTQGEVEDDIIQKNFKKGTLVYYAGSTTITPTDELKKQLGLVGNDVSSELVVSKYVPYSRDNSIAATTPIYRVSTPSNAETFVSQNLDFVGRIDLKTVEKKINGLGLDDKKEYSERLKKFKELPYDEQVRQLTRGEFHEFIDTSDVSRNTKRHIGKDIEKTIERSDMIRQADSTANWYRSRFDYDVAQKAEKLITQLHAEIKKNPNLSRLNTLSEPVRLREAYKYIVGALNGDKESRAYAQKFLEKTIGSVFGKKVFLDYGTVDNIGNALPYLSGTIDVIDYSLRKTDQILSEMSLNNVSYTAQKTIRNKYFKSIFQNSMAFLGSEVGANARESIGQYIKIPLTPGDKDTFAIDLSPIIPQNKIDSANLFSAQQRILRIPLSNDGAVNIAGKAAKILGTDPLQAIRAVSNLIGNIYEDASYLKTRSHHDGVAPTVESETADIIQTLRYIRTVDKINKAKVKRGTPEPVSILSMNVSPDTIDKAKRKYGSKDALFQALDVANKDYTADTYAPITKEKIQKAIGQVTENLFSETNKFLNGYERRTPEEQEAHHRVIQELCDKYGYSEHEAEEMVDDLFYRKRTVTGAVENIFKSVFSQGNPSLGFRYDKNGKLIFFDIDSGAEHDLTKSLPISRFDDRHGVFWMQQGNMHIATQKNVYFDKEHEQFKIGSVYDEWADSLKNSFAGFKNPKKDRTPEEKLSYISNYFSYVLKKISPYQTPANDLQDARKTFSVGFKQFILGLADFDINHIYGDTISDSTKKLLAVLSKKDYDKRDITNDQIKVISNDLYALISPFASGNEIALDLVDPTQREYFSRVFSFLNQTAVKHADQMSLYTSGIGIDPFMELGPASRGVANAMARANTIDLDEYNTLEKDDKERILLGQTVESHRTTARKTASLDDSERVIRGKILDIGTNDYLKVLKDRSSLSAVSSYLESFINENEITDRAEEIISMLQETLNENGSILDPRVLRILNRSIIQKTRTDNAISINRLSAALDSRASERIKKEEKLRRSTNELIEIINGRVSFRYSDKSAYINAGDTFFWEESYKGTASKTIADRAGFLERKYYRDTTNKVVSEDEIERILQDHIDEFEGLESDNSETTNTLLREKASEILRNAGITEKYSIASSDVLSYRKMLLDTEKSVSSYQVAHFGQFLPSLRGILQDIDSELSSKPLTPSDAVFKSYSTFTDYLNANSDKKVTIRDVQRAAGKNGFTDIKSIKDTYHMEQNIPYDALRAILGDRFGDEAEGVIGVTSSYAQEATKGSHRELGRIQSLFQEAFEKSGLSRDEFIEKVSPYIKTTDGKAAIMAGSKANNFSILDNYVIDAEKLFGESGVLTSYITGLREDGSGIPYTIRYANVMNLHDADEAAYNGINSDKGIKTTRRMLENMSQERWGRQALQEIAKTYGTEKDGKIVYDENGIGRFNYRYNGIAQLALNNDKTATLTVENESGGINDPIIRNMQEEIVAGKKSQDIVAYEAPDSSIHYTRGLDEIVQNGVPEKAAKAIVESFVSNGYSDIGSEAIYNTYAYEQGRMAISANNKLKTISDETEQTKYINDLSAKSNLEIVKINDVKSIDRYLRNDPARLVDKSFIIDLGDDIRASGFYGPDKKEFKSRYVVVPFTKSSVMDSNSDDGVYSKSEFVKKVEMIARAANDRNSGLDTDAVASELMSDIVKATNSKTGAIADATSGYMPTSAMFKADIVADEADTIATNKATIDGLSIAERNRQGLKSNAIFVGRDFFKQALNQDVVDAIGPNVDTEALVNAAQENGFAGIGLRQPMEYTNSVASARIFLDDSVSSNKARFSWSMANAMKADKDGDLVYSMLLRSRATIKRHYKDDNGEQTETILQNARLSQLDAEYIKNAKDGHYEVVWDEPDFFKKVDRARDYLERHAYSGIGKIDGDDMREKLASDTYIQDYSFGGKIYSGQAIAGSDMIRQKNEKRYQSIINTDTFKEHLNQWIADNDKQSAGIESTNLTYNELSDNQDRTGVANSYIEKLQNNKISAPEGMSIDDVAQAFAYQAQKTAVVHNAETSLSNANAGIANYHTYRLQVLKNMSRKLGETNMTNADDEIFGAVMTHMKEAFQAPKNNADAGLFTMDNLRYAVENFVGANKGGYVNKQPLYNIIESMYNSEDGIKELKHIPHMDDVQTVDGQVPLQRVLEAFDKVLPEGKRVSRKYWDSLSLGYGIAASETNVAEMDKNSILSHIESAANDVAQAMGDEGVQTENISLFENAKLMSNADRDLQDAFDEAHESHFGFNHTFDGVADSEDPGFVRKLAGSLHDVKTSMGSKGAMAMLGFAGMTMMAGVFGGAPTSPTPAQGQAQGIQSENAMYEIPSTISAGAAPSVNNKQSYIINVNASTDRGREFAETAINQAMSSVPNNSGNVSMTMNVKDSSSNMTYSDIASYVQNML